MNKFIEYLEQISEIKELPFVSDIERAGGYIGEAGGKVRDSFLGIESKDLDIVIYKLELQKLISILKKYGNVKITGNKFPVIKWTRFGSKEEVDIALPRTERKIGPTRNDFEVITSPDISPEEDVYRRDFTMNAIIKKLNGDIIDPYNGRLDIKNKIIRMINPDTFSPERGDELRMLRAVQFAARFKFKIEEKTLEAIRRNSNTIKITSKERIIEELRKILKGSIPLGVSYLFRTKLFNAIFDLKKIHFSLKTFILVKSFSELLFLLTYGNNIKELGKFNKQKIGIDNKTEKELNALNYFFNSNSNLNKRRLVFETNKIDSIIMKTLLIPESFKNTINEFKTEKYPLTIKDLKINGNDLTYLGFKGKEIGNTLDTILDLIYNDKLNNDKKEILDFLKYDNRRN